MDAQPLAWSAKMPVPHVPSRGIAGGSLLKSLGALVGNKDVDWSRFHIFFGDERNVPHSSPDSTIKGAREAFLSRVPIPPAQIHAIAEGLPVEVHLFVPRTFKDTKPQLASSLRV